MPRCTARNRAGEQCKRQAAKGKTVCHSHGGAEGSGAPVRHGRRSKLFQRLGILDTVERIRSDPELLSHRSNIETTEALIEALADGLHADPARWQTARELYARATTEQSPEAMRALGELLDAGEQASATAERLLELMEHQRKHRESEMKREAALGSMMSARQADALATALLTVVLEEVSDPPTKRRIAVRFERILRPDDPGRPAAIG